MIGHLSSKHEHLVRRLISADTAAGIEVFAGRYRKRSVLELTCSSGAQILGTAPADIGVGPYRLCRRALLLHEGAQHLCKRCILR